MPARLIQDSAFLGKEAFDTVVVLEIIISCMKPNQQQILIYKDKDGVAQLEVKLKEETVWLTLNQLAELFDTDKSGISRHISNIFKDREVNSKSTVAKIATVQIEGNREVEREIEYFNLDLILSVGYRVNSKRATQFRVWATSVLREHVLNGYTLNHKRLHERGLKELEETVALVRRTMNVRELTDTESKGLLDIITSYSATWLLLQSYDQGELKLPKTKKSRKKFDYDFCRSAIDDLKGNLLKKGEATDLFSRERSEHFKGILATLYQTFDKVELYPSIEEKAAHLIYFIIKDHPFVDGNKRVGSFLFIVFLAHNNHLLRKNGERKINDNALVALALLIAESDPKHKELMVRLVMHFLSG